MAEKKFVTRAQLNTVASAFSKLKKKEDERFPLKAAIVELSPTISAALEKGYSYPDIAEILDRDHGIEIKPATLASYHRNTLGSKDTAAQPKHSQRHIATSPISGGESDPGSPATLPLDTPGSADSKFTRDPELG